jgi:hypothetical protein
MTTRAWKASPRWPTASPNADRPTAQRRRRRQLRRVRPVVPLSNCIAIYEATRSTERAPHRSENRLLGRSNCRAWIWSGHRCHGDLAPEGQLGPNAAAGCNPGAGLRPAPGALDRADLYPRSPWRRMAAGAAPSPPRLLQSGMAVICLPTDFTGTRGTPVARSATPSWIGMLASCIRASQSEASDAGEDVVRGLDPHEWPWIGVMGREVKVDRVLQRMRAAVAAARKVLLHQVREPAFHLIDARRCWRHG